MLRRSSTYDSAEHCGWKKRPEMDGAAYTRGTRPPNSSTGYILAALVDTVT